MTHTLTNKTFWSLKGQLTKAKNTGNPTRIIHAVIHARTIYETDGFPDLWRDWPRALEDIRLQDIADPTERRHLRERIEHELREWNI